MGIQINNEVLGSGGSLIVDDDGTYYVFKLNSTTLFRIRKSDYQMQVQAGLDTDTSM